MTRNEMLDRCIAIEEEYRKNRRMFPLFPDPDSDAYQEKIEYSWWKDELQEEFDNLREKLSLPQKNLR